MRVLPQINYSHQLCYANTVLDDKHMNTSGHFLGHSQRNTRILRGILTGRIKNNPAYDQSTCFRLQRLVTGTFSGSNYEVVRGKFHLLTKTAIERAVKNEEQIKR